MNLSVICVTILSHSKGRKWSKTFSLFLFDFIPCIFHKIGRFISLFYLLQMWCSNFSPSQIFRRAKTGTHTLPIYRFVIQCSLQLTLERAQLAIKFRLTVCEGEGTKAFVTCTPHYPSRTTFRRDITSRASFDCLCLL